MAQFDTLVPEYFFVEWYNKRGRSFPWREDEVTPFELLLTEMLLRQTQAVQVERIWEEFVYRFGDPNLLKEADRQDIHDFVEPLGFGNQRTNALKAAANHILTEHAGSVPSCKEHLLDIPHVGPYSAQAVRCFAFGKRVPIVDTNILRLFCRLTGKQVSRPDIRRVDWVWDAAKSLLPECGDKAVGHNYGLLDFTAQICVARNPDCGSCQLSRRCAYGRAVARNDVPVEAW